MSLDLFTLSTALDLDPEQAAASQAPEGRNVVVAGAGTGKTRTLVARIVRLIRNGADPRSIRCVTFTNRAAQEISSRVASIFPNSEQPGVGTFHALACQVLRRHASLVGLTPKFMIIDDEERRLLIADVLKASGLAGEIPEVEKAVDGWKSSGLLPRHVLDPQRERRSAKEENEAQIYVALAHEMRRRNVLEFGDLALEAVEIMRSSPDAQVTTSAQIRHLLVDEAQDANSVQAEFARMLYGVHGDVFVVGDEDQSIYSFQGGSPRGLFAIAGPDANVWRLTRNRRSTDAILRPAVKLVAWNARAQEKVLSSGVDGPAPMVETFPSEISEAHFVSSEIRTLMRSGVSPDDIAILVRSGWVLPLLEEGLLRNSVPYELFGGTTFSKREEVKDVCAFLRLACDPYDDLAFRRICNKPTRGIGPATEESILGIAASHDLPFHEACTRLVSVNGARIMSREGLDRLGYLLFWLNHGYTQQNWSTEELLDFVLSDEGVGYEAWATRDRSTSRRKKDVLRILRRMAQEESDTVMLLERVALAGEEEDPDRDAKPKVRVATMHASKGLEWDHVFLPAFEKVVMPSPKASVPPRSPEFGDVWAGAPVGGIDEERRLAHVAFTRARKTLTITASTSRGGKNSGLSRFHSEAGLSKGSSLAEPFEKPMGFGKAKAPARPKKRRNALF
jgi:DNA helicase-2/ATP-dependent DNA helicase PcrA